MPERIGPYEVLAELGRGGMGRVYRARHVPTAAERALKVLDGVPDPESVERFRREAEALARLGGRGVVAVHDSGTERGRMWYGMDLVAGGSLAARPFPVPWREACALVARLARTLSRAHAIGLVHRDVKPANVLIESEGGEVRLADWGCARDMAASLTSPGTLIGTLDYMAPVPLDPAWRRFLLAPVAGRLRLAAIRRRVRTKHRERQIDVTRALHHHLAENDATFPATLLRLLEPNNLVRVQERAGPLEALRPRDPVLAAMVALEAAACRAQDLRTPIAVARDRVEHAARVVAALGEPRDEARRLLAFGAAFETFLVALRRDGERDAGRAAQALERCFALARGERGYVELASIEAGLVALEQLAGLAPELARNEASVEDRIQLGVLAAVRARVGDPTTARRYLDAMERHPPASRWSAEEERFRRRVRELVTGG